MKDKVEEFRKILNQRKAMEDAAPKSDESDTAPESDQSDLSDASDSGAALTTLQKKYEDALKANEIQKDMYMRHAAEFENSRKRLQKEQEDALKFAGERLLKELFPVLDSLEMTLSHVPEERANDPLVEGVRLTLKQFLQILEKNGLKEVGNEGERFDPNLHEAIGMESHPDTPANQIVRVHRKGYVLNGRLLRAAMVTVSS